MHFSENWAVTQKRLIIEQNGRKFGPRGCMWHACWYFLPWTCQGHFGSFSALFPKLARNSKTAHRRAKETKFFAPRVYVTCMLVFLPLNMSRSFGSFGALFQKLDCNSKTAHCRAKQTKIWAPLCITYMLVFLTLNMSRSFGVIQCTFP